MKKRSRNTDISSGGIHSRAYHSFFEGYSEFYALNVNGKRTVLRRVYTGETYCRDQTRARFILSKLLYGLFFAAGVCFFSQCSIAGRKYRVQYSLVHRSSRGDNDFSDDLVCL